jgi:hypothetical protein
MGQSKGKVVSCRTGSCLSNKVVLMSEVSSVGHGAMMIRNECTSGSSRTRTQGWGWRQD